jgi:hypothetical protein
MMGGEVRWNEVEVELYCMMEMDGVCLACSEPFLRWLPDLEGTHQVPEKGICFPSGFGPTSALGMYLPRYLR